MKQVEFLRSIDTYINTFERFSFCNNEVLMGQFNMVSASLSNFLPSIDFSRHSEIYRKILLYKKLSILDQSSSLTLDFVESENFEEEMMNTLKSKPAIICTFHTGSYRVINLLLTKLGIPFSLVMGQEVLQKEGDRFLELFNNLRKDSSALTIINAESATAGMQMLRTLKQGKSLVLYVDGNTGGGASTVTNMNSTTVNFLSQQLIARKGIAFLAHVAKVPILPVVSYRKSWTEIKLKFFDAIYPDKNPDREAFAKETTQFVYDLVSPIIKAYPGQWEGWLYVHKFANISTVQEEIQETPRTSDGTEKINFNSDQFGIFKIHDTPFLLKKNSYSFYEINSELYDLLINCIDQSVNRENFEDSTFSQLYQHGVIRP